MLCGQHALNAILQGNYVRLQPVVILLRKITEYSASSCCLKFTASDLAEIARELDELEAQFRDREEAPTVSVNMDDSGFFSVQVMDRALHVWGLT